MNKVELLAPVGKMENMYAAVENGADAIFLGAKEFSARYSAENFTIEEIQKIIKYCKVRGIKVYVTVNTLINEVELSKLFAYLEQLQIIGIDALIVQDLGIVRLIQRHFSTLVLHAFGLQEEARGQKPGNPRTQIRTQDLLAVRQKC